MKSLIRRLKNAPREELGYLLGNLSPGSYFEAKWRREGEFITFKPGGFARAESRPQFITRHEQETKYIREWIGGNTYRSSLEVGCGWGRLTSTIAAFSSNYVGIDINADALNKARAYHPGVEYQNASITAIPFHDNHFDLIVSWTVLQHISPDRFDDAVREIERVLQDDGTLLLCEATKNPQNSSAHTWDRAPNTYESAFQGKELVQHEYIQSLEPLPNMESPGEMMLFR